MINKIDFKFVAQIAREEHNEFEEAQQSAIEMRTNRVSGTLRNHFGNRKYSTIEKSDEVINRTVHPDYERYLDMRKTKRVTRTVARAFQDSRLRNKTGRKIHNHIIFGRLNPLSFRLMHEMKLRVKANVRGNLSSFS